jgi:hypothetical protein
VNANALNGRKLAVMAGLALVPTVALVVLLKDVAREALVVPILYAFWLAGLAIGSLHQGVVWVLLVLAVAVVLLRGLGSDPQGSTPDMRHPQPEATSAGRVAFWETQVRSATGEGYSGESSRHELRKLILGVLAYQRQTTPRQVEQSLQNGEVQVLPEMAPFLEASPRHLPLDSPGLFARLGGWLGRRWPFRPTPLAMPLEQDLARIVQFFETQLELADDPRGE